jgi:hypothetical protein
VNAPHHTILVELRRLMVTSAGQLVRAVVMHGHPYVAAPRPKGFRRQWARRQCFRNAGSLALRNLGTYVEGFAARPDQPPFHHAWITVDGQTAIDPTIPDAEVVGSYFGIAFPVTVVAAFITSRGHWGLLDPFDADLLRFGEGPGARSEIEVSLGNAWAIGREAGKNVMTVKDLVQGVTALPRSGSRVRIPSPAPITSLSG